MSDTDPATTAAAHVIHDAVCTCNDFEGHLGKQVQPGWIPDVARRALAAARPLIEQAERQRIRQHFAGLPDNSGRPQWACEQIDLPDGDTRD